jgi:hypothetical protein
MGRESRQARRARQRREQQRGQAHRRGTNWSVIIGLGVIAALIAVLAVATLTHAGSNSNQTATIPTPTPGKTIQGIGCNYNMYDTYHVHAHLTVLDAGRPVTVPAYIGDNLDHDCFYWLHTHNATGIIHIEAPHAITPTLGAFLAVSQYTIQSSIVPKLKAGQHEKIWVNLKPYHGSLNSIKLGAHTDITVEVGPPFRPPQPFNFAKYQV